MSQKFENYIAACVALGAGEKIQCLEQSDHWHDWEFEDIPPTYGSWYDFRIAPKPEVLQYQVALMKMITKSKTSYYVEIVDAADADEVLWQQGRPGFVEWVTAVKEVVVNSNL